MKRKKNEKGFSLVELLAVVVILGLLSTIAIIGVNAIIKNAEKQHYETQKNTLKMAAQSYAQTNRNVLPKSVGSSTNVNLKTLVNQKYVEKLKTRQGKECDTEKSYVTIFKYSKDGYSYTPHLVCPGYEKELEEDTNTGPTIEFLYNEVDKSTGKSTTPESFSNSLNKTTYNNPTITLNIKSDNSVISYQYIIYKCESQADGTETCDTELKNSGSVAVARQKSQKATIEIKEYLPGTLKLTVVSTDVTGVTSTKDSMLTIKPTTGPTCGETTGEGEKWITMNDPETSRNITIKCIDTNGTGCEREIYSQLFDTDTGTGYITIKDNAGNTTNCPVKVLMDKAAPSTPTITNPNNNKWTNKDYNVTAESTDKTSGIEKFQYRYPNSKDPEEQKWTDFSEKNKDKLQIPQTKERSEILEIRACDVAGNCSAAAKTTVKLDKTAPTCKVTKSIATPNGTNGWYTSKIDVNLVTENPTTDKVTAVASKVSYGFATTNKVTYNSKNKYTQGTTKGVTYYGFVKDEAGNTNTCNSGNIKVDTSAPTLVFTVKELYTAVATCTDDDSGLVNTGNSWKLSSNITHSYTCENKAGLTTTKSGKYTYSTCVAGSPNQCFGDWQSYSYSYSYSYSCNCKKTCDYLPESVECWTFCSTCYGTSTSWNSCAYTRNTCRAGYVVS